MASYCVNRNEQPNGDHEVHVIGCLWTPNTANQIYLGEFSSCYGAVAKAREHYTQVDGCKHCSTECHTS